MKVAILDDYPNVALQMADWSAVRRHAEITVFNDHVADPSAVVARLHPFDVVCVMRERTPLTREILEKLPNLKLIASTGPRNAAINSQTAANLGIAVTMTGYDSTPTIEFTWSLILASMRGLDREVASLRRGGWQTGLGANLRGRTLGVLGLGNVGGEVARIGAAFGMKVIAWSQNLTAEKAHAVGATTRRQADAVSRCRHRHGPCRAEPSHERPGRRGGICTDEAVSATRQHVTRADRGRARLDRSTASAPYRRRRD